MELVSRFELLPRYTNVKSFYGKADVMEFNDNGTDIFVLYSHTIPVLIIFNKELYRVKNDGTYTRTTLQHCREFAKQFNYSIKTKKEFLKLKLYDF